jgi:hypothetical protein
MSLNFPDEPSDGDIFEGYVYNATRNVWDVKLPSDNNIEDLNNVNLTSPANGQALVYNTTSSNWVNQNQTFSGLTDTSFASPVTGDSLVYNGTSWVNGPRSGNAIINGDFDIWQRSSSANLSMGYPAADRWLFTFGNAVQTGTFSRQSFSPGELSVPGYGQPGFYARVNVTNNNSSTYSGIEQRIEDVRTFSAQQVTMSFWAKASSALSLGAVLVQNFGSGGSTEVATSQVNVNLTSSWQRFTYTVTLPSVSGKTIGAGNHLEARLVLPLSSYTIDIWGVQLESGPVATQFKLFGGGSKGAELALCQRYYEIVSIGGNTYHGQYASNPNRFYGQWVQFQQNKRVSPALSYQYTGGTEYWVIVSTTAHSAISNANISFSASQSGVQMNQGRAAGNAAVVNGNLYVYEAAFNIRADSEI